MQYDKYNKAELIFLLGQKEEQVVNLQLKLQKSRDCADCLSCDKLDCKNNLGIAPKQK